MSAQQRGEPIDTFGEASPGIEEGSYRVQYKAARRVEGQYGPQNCHILTFPDLPDEQILYYTPTSLAKRTRQRIMAEAFLGRDIEDGEEITPRDLRGKIAEAFIEINAKGYPAIKGLTRLRKAAPRRAPAPAPDEDSDDPFAVDDEAAE